MAMAFCRFEAGKEHFPAPAKTGAACVPVTDDWCRLNSSQGSGREIIAAFKLDTRILVQHSSGLPETMGALVVRALCVKPAISVVRFAGSYVTIDFIPAPRAVPILVSSAARTLLDAANVAGASLAVSCLRKILRQNQTFPDCGILSLSIPCPRGEELFVCCV